MYWHGMRQDVERYIKICVVRQRCKVKRTNQHLRPKKAETILWHRANVDPVSPYEIKSKRKNLSIAMYDNN